jgi:predicted DNA-binding transcriptional regulator YafY
MIQTSARLLALLSALQRQRFWSGEALCEALEVTPRTVRRDVAKLRSLGYPVFAEAGVGGGYQLGAGKELPPLPLEDDEAVAVAVGLQLAAAGAVSGVEEASLRALSKLDAVLPKRLRKRVAALDEATVRLSGPNPSRADARVLSQLSAACRDLERVRFEYAGRDGARTKRDVEPLKLGYTGRRWYLLAFDVRKGEWRTFRADRIVPPLSSGPRFTPRKPPSEDVTAYLTDALSSSPYRYRARLTLHVSAEVARTRIPPSAGRIVPVDSKRCTLHSGSDSLGEMAFYLGLIGFDFEVHEPPELREHLREMAGRLVRAAQSK